MKGKRMEEGRKGRWREGRRRKKVEKEERIDNETRCSGKN
jgi:hypothetical protein